MTITRLSHGNPKHKPYLAKIINKIPITKRAYLVKCECGESFIFHGKDAKIEKTKANGTWVNINCPCCKQFHTREINTNLSKDEEQMLIESPNFRYEYR
jgi:hypothetical protein